MGAHSQRAKGGVFHFTVLVTVDEPSDLLSFRPVITDEAAHLMAAGAWAAGASALTDRLYALSWRLKARGNVQRDI
jgi:hypothetical protein